jgi:CheY-like chemotaxis protein
MGEGTGLGLSVVRGIVQAHDGAIVVSSLPAAGTTFTIYLPAARAQTETGASTVSDTGTHSTTFHGQSRRLLYVDDDESIVFLVRRLLERRGFKVSGFTDAREALQALAADPTAFDLMLSDYNMPNLSGLDVARAVRDIRADLPVGIVSGFIDERLLSQAKSVGVRELIVKAGDVKEFCEAIQRLMDSLPPAAQPLAATGTAISA